MATSKKETKEADVYAGASETGEKSYLAAWLLSASYGIFGLDRFYLGYTGLGIVKLLTLGGCGVWALIDWILIFAGSMKDAKGRPLHNRDKDFRFSMTLFLIWVGYVVLYILFWIVMIAAGLLEEQY